MSAETSTDICPLDDVPKNPTYAQLRELERVLAQLPQVEAKITHHFAHGVYGREMFVPAGTMLTGKIHRFSTLNLLVKGEMTATTDSGVRRISAPAIFVSPPNCKKVGYAHTDVIWVNVHATKLQDIEAIENKFIVPELPLALEEK